MPKKAMWKPGRQAKNPWQGRQTGSSAKKVKKPMWKPGMANKKPTVSDQKVDLFLRGGSTKSRFHEKKLRLKNKKKVGKEASTLVETEDEETLKVLEEFEKLHGVAPPAESNHGQLPPTTNGNRYFLDKSYGGPFLRILRFDFWNDKSASIGVELFFWNKFQNTPIVIDERCAKNNGGSWICWYLLITDISHAHWWWGGRGFRIFSSIITVIFKCVASAQSNIRQFDRQMSIARFWT